MQARTILRLCRPSSKGPITVSRIRLSVLSRLLPVDPIPPLTILLSTRQVPLPSLEEGSLSVCLGACAYGARSAGGM